MAPTDHGKTPQLPLSPAPSVLSPTPNDRAIAERIAVLLAHFWAPDMNQELRTAIARDWLEDLREFPAPIVAAACTEWRRSQTKRPQIADIRGLCLQMRGPRAPVSLAPRLESRAAVAAREHDEQRAQEVREYEQRKREARQRAYDWRRSEEGRDFLNSTRDSARAAKLDRVVEVLDMEESEEEPAERIKQMIEYIEILRQKGDFTRLPVVAEFLRQCFTRVNAPHWFGSSERKDLIEGVAKILAGGSSL